MEGGGGREAPTSIRPIFHQAATQARQFLFQGLIEGSRLSFSTNLIFNVCFLLSLSYNRDMSVQCSFNGKSLAFYANSNFYRDINTLTKKKITFASYIRKFRMEQLQSHI